MLARWMLRRVSRPNQGRLGGVAPWAVLLALCAVAVSVAVGTPRPSLSGVGLGVTLATLVVLGAGLYLVVSRDAQGVAPAVAVGLLAFGSAALAGLAPDSPGYLGAFIAVGAVALRVSPGVARTVCAATVAAMSAALALSRSRPPAVAIVSIDLGLIFVFALATFSREQQRLLAAVREAQAARAQAAALQERARLAREIHDVLAHSLTGLSVQLETARLMLQRASAPAEAVLQVEQAGALARTGLEETRRAVQALRGDAMPGPELLPALAAEFGEREGVPCQFSVRGAASADALGAEARLALYRTAQEALTNVRKHARASRVEMTLEWAEDTVSLSVVDHASAPAAVASALSQHDLSRTGGGYGLSGLRERAELLGGSLTAAPSGDGFRVVLRLPRSPRACDE